MKNNIVKRSRRLRKTDLIRKLVQETRLHIDDFVAPVFVKEGSSEKVESMPGVTKWSLNEINREIDSLYKVGINKIMLFGIPQNKDDLGSAAYNKEGIVQKTILHLKNKYPDLFIIADVCLCSYTDHGHCGIINNNEINNDLTLELIAKQSLSYAFCGVDMVAPSCMMDGMVGFIRNVLDQSSYEMIPIMSYSVKYASSFYGPFRDAAECSPRFGDRKTYQMDISNIFEAIKESKQDIEEGADIIMVKPALPYLDVISTLRKNISVPIAAYNVSGEYSMIKAASDNGWLDYNSVMREMLISIKRSGADIIISYFSKDIGELLNK